MPESTEVYIMSEFLNKKLGHSDVIKVEKNPMSKNKCDLSPLEGKRWKVSTKSRGKEMMVEFNSGEETLFMKVGFARIGNIQEFALDELETDDFKNRAMLRFYTEDRVYAVSDFTRYVIWRWADEWDVNRSPDVFLEHNQWRSHIYHHRQHKYFKRPIFDLMCDQRFFNGVGNFSRAEILARTRFSPFTHFSEILETEILREDFFSACKETMWDIVRFGGLQFEHWKNPFGVPKDEFNSWVRCYKNLNKSYYIKDSAGRLFWFPKKWANEYALWIGPLIEELDIQDTRLFKKIYRKTKKQNNGSNNHNNPASR